MNNGGGDQPSPPLLSGEYLLQLLRRSPPPTQDHPPQHPHPPFAPHTFFNRFPPNPRPIPETIQTSGTYQNFSPQEGNSSSAPLPFSGNSNPVNSPNEANYQNTPNCTVVAGGNNRAKLNGYEADYRNSPNPYAVGGGYGVALNGHEASYRNVPGLSQDLRNLSLDGHESSYQNSPNYGRVGGGYNRALNGYETSYRNSPNWAGIGRGYRYDSNFQKNVSMYSKNRGTTSKAVEQYSPGAGKKTSNKNLGQNVNKEKGNSNGSREWSVTNKDEREKSGVIGERRLSTQLDSPSLPVGNRPSSASGFEVEESLSELQSEIGENREKQRELDIDLGDVDGAVSGHWKKNRSKDYRLDTRGQRVLSQGIRKSSRQLQCRDDIDMLTAPLLAIYDSLIPQEEEKMKQNQLLSVLEDLVIKEWPEARLFVYGSCANSFGVRNSDIDICLAIKDVDDVDKSEVLWRLADILNEEKFKNVQALTHARVPIVKFMDSTTEISCDICINNVLAVVNSKLLRDYAKIDDRLRQLAFIVKHWAKSRGVNETYHGTLSSYAYVLMCIHFLQQCRPAILPCLQEMDPTYSVVVDNVECSFFDQIEKLSGFGSRNRDNIGRLVWGFFRYWAFCHDYAHDVICVRGGRTISKRDKEWTTKIGRDRHLICIEDPFEISHDLGRVVDKRSIKVLKEEFERAAKILQFDPNPSVTLFEPYVPN